jgi:hypothetical protein
MKHFNAIRFALAALLVGGYPAGLAAQDDDNTPYGTTSAEFLLLGAGARGAALGGAFAAIANDATALYYNPAGTALMSQPGISLSTYSYVADTRYSWGGVAFPFSGGARAFGLHLGTFGFKDQPVYTAEQPEGTGSVYSVNETYVGATYAENFSDRFSAGLTAKFIFDQLGDAEGNAFAVDFGTNFHSALNDHPIKFSFVIQNLGTNLSYSGDALISEVPREPLPGEDPVPSLPQPATLRTKAFALPTVFRVGLAYDVLTGEDTRWTVLGDFNQANNNKAGFVFGSELAFNRLGDSGFGAAVRGSYSYTGANGLSPANSSDTQLSEEEDLQGLALGGGLGYQGEGFSIGFDYAWRYLGILGSTNYFTFNIGW